MNDKIQPNLSLLRKDVRSLFTTQVVKSRTWCNRDDVPTLKPDSRTSVEYAECRTEHEVISMAQR